MKKALVKAATLTPLSNNILTVKTPSITVLANLSSFVTTKVSPAHKRCKSSFNCGRSVVFPVYASVIILSQP